MKLLVSVRNMAEARVALAAKVDLLDLKEPRKGSLGATEPLLWQQVRELAGEQVPLSAALGELHDWPLQEHAKPLDCLTGFSYAKVGLAGMAAEPLWFTHWQQFGLSLPKGVQPVAVAYADRSRADSPTVGEVIDRACELGWQALLIDTFDKQHGSLFDHLSAAMVGQVIAQAKSAGMLCVLAGSLDLAAIRTIAELNEGPDFIAVRGAACRSGRESQLDPHKIEQLQQVIHG